MAKVKRIKSTNPDQKLTQFESRYKNIKFQILKFWAFHNAVLFTNGTFHIMILIPFYINLGIALRSFYALVKLRYCERSQNFKTLPLKKYLVTSKQSGRFFKFLWPSQNI